MTGRIVKISIFFFFALSILLKPLWSRVLRSWGRGLSIHCKSGVFEPAHNCFNFHPTNDIVSLYFDIIWYVPYKTNHLDVLEYVVEQDKTDIWIFACFKIWSDHLTWGSVMSAASRQAPRMTSWSASIINLRRAVIPLKAPLVNCHWLRCLCITSVGLTLEIYYSMSPYLSEVENKVCVFIGSLCTDMWILTDWGCVVSVMLYVNIQ